VVKSEAKPASTGTPGRQFAMHAAISGQDAGKSGAIVGSSGRQGTSPAMVDIVSRARAFGTAANGPRTNPNTRRTRTWPMSCRRTIMLSIISRRLHCGKLRTSIRAHVFGTATWRARRRRATSVPAQPSGGHEPTTDRPTSASLGLILRNTTASRYHGRSPARPVAGPRRSSGTGRLSRPAPSWSSRA